MKPGSTRSIASRSHPLIATICHRPVNRASDLGTPFAMRCQSSQRWEDRFEVPPRDGAQTNHQGLKTSSTWSEEMSASVSTSWKTDPASP